VPRTKLQNEQIREARKEKIRIEALKQFAAKGFFATRIQDIAKGIGMAQGLFYHYYSSKDAIFVDLMNDAMNKLNKASLYVMNMNASAKEKILFSLCELFKTIETNECFRQTYCLIAQAENLKVLPIETQRLIEEERDKRYRIIVDIMRQGQKEGSVVDGDPLELAILFWTSVNGMSIYCANCENPGMMPNYKLLATMFLREKSF